MLLVVLLCILVAVLCILVAQPASGSFHPAAGQPGQGLAHKKLSLAGCLIIVIWMKIPNLRIFVTCGIHREASLLVYIAFSFPAKLIFRFSATWFTTIMQINIIHTQISFDDKICYLFLKKFTILVNNTQYASINHEEDSIDAS